MTGPYDWWVFQALQRARRNSLKALLLALLALVVLPVAAVVDPVALA